jgi:hypothetical protein
MATEFRHFLTSEPGTVRPMIKSARTFAPITDLQAKMAVLAMVKGSQFH